MATTASAPQEPRSISAREAAKFIIAETMLLDRGQLEQWLELYTDELRYWIPGRNERSDPSLEISIVYDDRKHLEERVRRNLSEHTWAQRPRSRTLHLVGDVLIDDTYGDAEVQGDGACVTSRQLIIEHRNGNLSFYPALCEYVLVQANEVRMRSKTVMLLNAEDPIGNLTFLL